MTTAIIHPKYNIQKPFFTYWEQPRQSEKQDIKSFSVYDSINQGIDDVFSSLGKYHIEIDEKMNDFLKSHQGIIKYLLQAPEVIFRHFDSRETNLSLKLSYDPEVENDEGELFLYIKTNLSPKDAHGKLNQIDEYWPLNVQEEDMAFFNLNLRFI